VGGLGKFAFESSKKPFLNLIGAGRMRSFFLWSSTEGINKKKTSRQSSAKKSLVTVSEVIKFNPFSQAQFHTKIAEVL
jgi:hypothetical protein